MAANGPVIDKKFEKYFKPQIDSPDDNYKYDNLKYFIVTKINSKKTHNLVMTTNIKRAMEDIKDLKFSGFNVVKGEPTVIPTFKKQG